MSSSEITYTPEEQVKLNEFDRQVQAFNNFRMVVARSLYQGQDAPSVQQLLQFLHEIASQASKQMEEIKVLASQRLPQTVEGK